MDGTQACACAAFASRLRCVSAAPFGVPVVPEVYWMIARSSVCGLGADAGRGADATSESQLIAPRTLVVSASREARALAIGSFSASRVNHGMAFVTSTETMLVTARSSGKSCTVSTTLLHTIAWTAP